MPPEQFIIEHQSRGVLMDQDHDPYGRSSNVYLEWRSKFSHSKLRSEAVRFHNLEAARLALSRLHPTVRRNATIRRWGTWAPVVAGGDD
jgi:hypothetical protein